MDRPATTAPRRTSVIEPTPTTLTLLWFLALPALGRCFLAWLPPGLPGRHTTRDIGATWAASFLIASTIVVALAESPWGLSSGSGTVIGLAIAGLALIAGVVRHATRPAAMVPRHEPPIEREGPVTRAILVGALLLAAWPLVEAWRGSMDGAEVAYARVWIDNDVFVAASRVAFVLTAAHALEIARCAPWTRAVGCAAAAIALHVTTGEHARGQLVAAALAGIGAAWAIPWLRRGDTRARALSTVAYAGAALVSSGGWMLALAGVLWLVVGSPKPVRARTAILGAILVAVAIAIGPGFERMSAWTLDAAARGSSGARATFTTTPFTSLLSGALLLVVVFALWQRARTPRRPAWNPSGAAPGHDEAILLRALITFLALRLLDQRLSARPSFDDPMVPAMALLAISAALASRTFTRAPRRA